jgi:ABC-2 type transport system ATP-binding protein
MIRIENLTKYYGERLAVDDISFSVEQGEIVGFLGPNGAGKSTTMRIITGFLMPTRGDAFVGDHNMATESLQGRRHIGYLPEIVPLYTDMTTRAYLEYVARLRGVERRAVRGRVDDVVEQCALEEYYNVQLAKLSKGFRQRVGLAQSIIHDPEVLILDEPTIGIDPIQVSQTRQLIRDLGKNRTILLSSHILPEVSMVCERVIIIHQGQIVAEDSIDHLSTMVSGSERLRLSVAGPADGVSATLEAVPGVAGVTYNEPNHLVEFAAGEQPHGEITAAIVARGWTLTGMETVTMSLEEIFLQLTQDDDADETDGETDIGDDDEEGAER